MKTIKIELDQRSDFFCSAKWAECYLYLNSGLTNSCHHPLPQPIDTENLLENPAQLHNSKHKLKMQELMVQGHRPNECHMCWHLEDLDPLLVSDRIYKSEYLKNMGVDPKNLTVDSMYVPAFLEVVFDNLCNLNCTYCDSGQSTSWAKDLKINGPYNLRTDTRKLYQDVHLEYSDSENIYTQAFWRWWPDIANKLSVLKLSGGETLQSPTARKFIKLISESEFPYDFYFSVNTNLSYPTKNLELLKSTSTKTKGVVVAASIDAVGPLAEYVRHGLDFNQFQDNADWWCTNTDSNCMLFLQSTVSILSIWGFVNMLDYNLELHKKYPGKIYELYSTIVRMPDFQSPALLPGYLKQKLIKQITQWLETHKSEIITNDLDKIRKLVTFLENEPAPYNVHSQEDLRSDLKKFILEYDRRNKLNFEKTFDPDFVDWVMSASE